MKKFEITGMSCAACSCRVEKAVQNAEEGAVCHVAHDGYRNAAVGEECQERPRQPF